MEQVAKINWMHMVKTSMAANIFRILLAALLINAGIGHLIQLRAEYAAIVPAWIPLSADMVVVLSGIIEIIFGLILILLPKWKALTGWVVAIFFILVFPGNIDQYINQTDAFGLNTDTARLIRLFFQPVLILWTLWSTGAYKAFKQRNNN
jgi:uncharacterized membrane protein